MPNDDLHDGMPDLLSIDNMGNGVGYEMFNEAMQRAAENIADVMTDPTQKRRVSLQVEIKPFKDRSGAELTITVDTKLAGLKGADGSMYIARKNGRWLPFARNQKQDKLQFGMDETAAAKESTGKPQ